MSPVVLNSPWPRVNGFIQLLQKGSKLVYLIPVWSVDFLQFHSYIRLFMSKVVIGENEHSCEWVQANNHPGKTML